MAEAAHYGPGAAAGAHALAEPSGSSCEASHRRRSPAAWLRRVLRGAQAVAEERPGAEHPPDDDHDDDDLASDDGAAALVQCASFGSLPEHLLEKVFAHLRGANGANRKHHFALCGVNRQWRRLGRAMFFSRPWEVAHLICHPTQLFCLSPRNVTGSRSGLLKCFVRREHGPGGKRFTFHIGKDASQPQRSRFLMAAKQGGHDEAHLFLNSRCKGQPCARLRCNMFATQYKLVLAGNLHLEPTGSRSGLDSSSGDSPPRRAPARGPSHLQSWGKEAAAEAVAAARQRAAAAAADASQLPLCQLGVDCFAELQYQARVKGFMQPRRMRVTLPNPKLLFYDQALPQLSRRASLDLPASSSGGGGASGSGAAPAGQLAAGVLSSCSLGASPEGSPAVAGAGAPPAASGAGEAGDVGLPPAGGARLGRLLQRVHLRRSQTRTKLLRQHKTVPADESLQPVILQNKAPHWNEGLRCWCLNFRGRVKLASVKNFQLVRAGDATERVVMQFGKSEQDAFVLDFNPMVLTAAQAFAIVMTTFSSKMFL